MDPLLNSGRPWEPQSWNRYAYTLNNPLRYTDPDGLWEFGACSFSDAECGAYQDRIRTAYKNLVNEAQSFKAGSRQRKELDRVIGYLGKEGDRNGVMFALGSLPGARGAQFDQTTKTITFDLPKLDKLFFDPRVSASGYSRNTEVSATMAHEGTHLADQQQGLVNLLVPMNRRIDWTALGNSEMRSYSNESYVHEAAGTRSINQLWNPSWAAADAESLRSKNVSKAAQESIKDLKDQAAAIGVR